MGKKKQGQGKFKGRSGGSRGRNYDDEVGLPEDMHDEVDNFLAGDDMVKFDRGSHFTPFLLLRGCVISVLTFLQHTMI